MLTRRQLLSAVGTATVLVTGCLGSEESEDPFEHCSIWAAHTNHYRQSSDFRVEEDEYIHVSVVNEVGSRTIVRIENPDGERVLQESVSDEAAWRIDSNEENRDTIDAEDAGWWHVLSQPHDEGRETTAEVLIRTCTPEE